jgi:UDP-N-acetylglucosamine--N-acetylmuramyl-(pentapeptide) pyrophosphoryl-undecaprenol N-acetylglucosamine transferase
MDNTVTKKIVIAAGGTGGHIFPALSVALVMKQAYKDVSLEWIGTGRSREIELCRKHGIPIVELDVVGMKRGVGLATIASLMTFVRAVFTILNRFCTERPLAVVAFGGYVCAPVLAAAVLKKVPVFLHEQNTIAGLVNRMFSRFARKLFLGFPLAGKAVMSTAAEITGTPVRVDVPSYTGFPYPQGLDRTKKTILICGGSQGAQSMNDCLPDVVRQWASAGIQVVWQTGATSYDGIAAMFEKEKNVFTFATIDDLYPYYAISKLVVGRAGASTLAEISYFGLPCVLVPLPWAAENHQWVNAGLVEAQGWGIRVQQDGECGRNVGNAVAAILSDEKIYDTMSMKALDNSPGEAAGKIVASIAKELDL